MPRAEAAEDTQKAPLSKLVLEKYVHVGSDLIKDVKDSLIAFLHENQDVFAWLAKDLQGINRDLTQHNLNVTKGAKPRKQKLRKMSVERVEATKAEVQRLLDVGIIRSVQYSKWLANVVMVRKKNGKWRMCVDFTNLNKCCLKDPYALPRIDKLVDIIVGCEVMSLLDCLSGVSPNLVEPE